MLELIQKNGAILALDVIEKNKAFEVLRETYDLLDAIKVGYPLILSCGIQICKEIKNEFNKPIIGDFKIADVPVTNEKIIDLSFENGIDFLMIHGFIGEENLIKAKKHSKNKLDLFMVTELTSDIGTNLFPYKKFAKWAVDLDFYGVQAPATKPEVIKEVKRIAKNSLKIISCGMGTQGAHYGSAIKNGADFEIIGRGIYASENPRERLEEYISMIRGEKNELSNRSPQNWC